MQAQDEFVLQCRPVLLSLLYAFSKPNGGTILFGRSPLLLTAGSRPLGSRPDSLDEFSG